MSRHALVKDGAILEYRDAAPNVDQSELHPAKPRLLPVEVERPEFDPQTEVLAGPVYEIESARVVERYTVEARPLDQRKAEMLAIVQSERDRRMRLPFAFAGHTFDYDDQSQKRITGAAALAGFALTLGGKLPGDSLWHGGAEPFVWIAADNQLVPMDAVMCFGLGQAAANWESAHIFAAKALKNAIEVAEDHDDLDAINIEAGWEF